MLSSRNNNNNSNNNTIAMALLAVTLLLLLPATIITPAAAAAAFVPFQAPRTTDIHITPTTTSSSSSSLAAFRFGGGNNKKDTNTNTNSKNAADDDVDARDLIRFDKTRRSADATSRVVELNRPLGLVLNEDAKTGNVYVEAIAPKGNAARTGLVQEGDLVTMCSATFGDDMWSTRGVGLSRVLAAIRVRSGATVKLCLERPNETRKKAQLTKTQLAQMEAARQAAQDKKDALLAQLEQDEKRLKKGKFLGLF